MRKTILLVAFLSLLFGAPAIACLWDYDTLRDEKRGMPGIAEVLAGQWERHSQFFYEDRVKKMKAVLATKPADLDAMDNLAVAYHKLGKTDQAITVMLDKDKCFPGQYTTYSNLGTFYMLTGRLDDAINCLKKALAINPDAHFGREEYQLDLAEYLKKVRSDPKLRDYSFICLVAYGIETPPTTATEPCLSDEDKGQLFEADRRTGNPGRPKDMGLKDNIFDGVVGMLRFGTDQSPDLYFALGDLLALHGDKNLAVRAYQRAIDLNYPRPQAIKRAMQQVEEMQVPKGGLSPAVIAAERADAKKWVSDYQQFEDDLVRSGKCTDAEANYAPFYATHGRSLATRDRFLTDYLNDNAAQMHPVAAFVAIALFATTLVLGGRLLLRRARRLCRSLLSKETGRTI